VFGCGDRTLDPGRMGGRLKRIAGAAGRCSQQARHERIEAPRRGHRSWFEAVVTEAEIRRLTWHGLRHTFRSWLAMSGASVIEVMDAARRLLELRGEKLRLSPEKVGHRLRKVGLPTRRLTKDGNGLVLNTATLGCNEAIYVMYVGEDPLPAMEARINSQATESLHLWR